MPIKRLAFGSSKGVLLGKGLELPSVHTLLTHMMGEPLGSQVPP